MADTTENTKRSINWSRWAIASLPLGLFSGFVTGMYFGNPAIGVAIGAALGFGGAAALLAAAVAFRSPDNSGP